MLYTTYTTHNPHKLYNMHNPTQHHFDCYYRGKRITVRAEGRHVARDMASKRLGVSYDAPIVIVRR